ncbi:MAG: FtsX-like permease family protein [Bacteroidales bacterium]|nr:FtsX-like permease family protein [Bacteroidales bacterium]
MFRIICKNLWARRKRNIWLFLELIVVTIVTWVVIDPVIVNYYVLHNELNFDVDRLVLLEGQTNGETGKRWQEENPDAESQVLDSLCNLEAQNTVATIRTWSEVEHATYCATYGFLNGNASLMGTMTKAGDDGFVMWYKWIEFPQNAEFFQTYGFRPLPGSPSLAELDNMHFEENDKIITRTMANALLPGVENPVGKRLSEMDTIWNNVNGDFRVAAVIEDIRYRSTTNEPYVFVKPEEGKDFGYLHYVVRMKEGVDLDDFCANFNNHPPKDIDGYYLTINRAMKYRDQMDEVAESMGVYSEMKLKVIVAVLFLINLCLGVIGAFYLQTRQRREEAGIMRSFGARRGRIMAMLMTEGWILTTVAWVIGCGIYLLWALHEGLSTTVNENAEMYAVPVDWTHRFWVHFPFVSLIVYGILILVVLVGILAPAYRMSRINPVDALHED